jgi:hypothetical protein
LRTFPVIKYRIPIEPKALAPLLVYVPIEFKILLAFNLKGNLLDLGYPLMRPRHNPRIKPDE